MHANKQNTKTKINIFYNNNLLNITVKMVIRLKRAKYANTDHEEGYVISFSLVVNKVMLKHS